MKFPLADWIDEHPDCRYDLATSGMRGSVAPPPWPVRRPDPLAPVELRRELADHLGVAPERVFLARGAQEANAWVLGFLARELGGPARSPVLRVQFPEYPPLFDAGRACGFAVRGDRAAAELAVVSRPRNPEGDLWSEEEVARFGEGSRHLLVDETFREFSDTPSLSVEGSLRLWTTGSFTKFFGGDEARVGWAVAPPEQAERFGHRVGLLTDELAPASAATALGLLRGLGAMRRAVRRVLDRNLRALARACPGTPRPVAPLFFDRAPRESGRQLAERCLAGSILVCPGVFFGEPRGVRICLTRRNFPDGLKAYLSVRRRAPRGSVPAAGR